VRSWLTETMRAQDVCRIMIEQTIIKCGYTYDDYRNDLPKNMVVHVNKKVMEGGSCLRRWNVKIDCSEPIQRDRCRRSFEIKNGFVINNAEDIAMHDTRRLRESLHPKDCPKIDRRKEVFPIRWVATQYQQVVTKYSEKGTRRLFWRKAFYLNRAGITLRVNEFKCDCNLPHNPCQQKGTIHDESAMWLHERTWELSSHP